MNQKGFSSVALVLILIAVILIGVVGYFVFVKKSQPPIQPVKTGWKVINWHDPYNEILGFRFDAPESWTEDPTSSERQITVASCPINTCDRMSFDVQVGTQYNPPTVIPSEWTKTKVDVGGVSADKLIKPTDSAILTDIYFQKDGNWYVIGLYTSNTNKQQADPIFDYMVASFQFTTAQPPQAPAGYQLFKDIDEWTLTYQDKNINAMSCSDGKKGNTATDYVFTMTSSGYGEPPGDIDTPYGKVITVLQSNGWQQCKSIGTTELQETQGTSEVFIKNNKLIGVFKHYSMGVGNSLRVSIQY